VYLITLCLDSHRYSSNTALRLERKYGCGVHAGRPDLAHQAIHPFHVGKEYQLQLRDISLARCSMVAMEAFTFTNYIYMIFGQYVVNRRQTTRL